MTDKVQKIREEVEMVVNRRLNLLNGDYFDLNKETNGFTNEIMDIIDSLQKEPVSKEIGDYDHKAVMESLCPQLKEEPTIPDIVDEHFWKMLGEEPVSEDLGEYINELSKQFPEVSFAKLSRIAVRVAKWQEEQFEKERLKHCDELTKEQAQIESDFVTQHLKKNNRTPTFIDAIEYGMKMQKEQMMAKAVETTFNVSLPSGLYDKLWIKDCKEGDKLLVFKKD